MRHALAGLLTTIVPTAVGYRLVRGHALLRLGLGAVLGIAILALGTMLGGLVGSAWAGSAVSMLVALGASFVVRRAQADGEEAGPPLLPLVLVLLVGAFLLVIAWSRPVSKYDGWAFWSLKAKAIASTGDFSSPVFTEPEYEYSHRDYPPLLPAWQALAYKISGDPTVGSPTQFQFAWLWTAAGVALVALAGRRRTLAGFALFAWVLAPQVVEESVSGYADVPMALFLVLGVIALLRSERLGPWPGAILIAAAAVTKGEGLVFALAALAPLVVSAAYRKRALVAAGAVVIAFGSWVAFTSSHGLTGDVTRPPLEAGHIDRDRDPVERVPTVLEDLGKRSIKPGDWGVLAPASLIAAAAVAFRPRVVAAGAAAAFIAWIAVYLATPFEVEWHLMSSADRVLIAPLGLLALVAEARRFGQLPAASGAS